MPTRAHDIYISTIGGTAIGFMLTRTNGRRSYSVVDAQTIAPRLLTEEQISQAQLPPDLALTFPQTSWHRGIGGIRYEASDPDVLADGTLIDVTERGVIKLARNIVASTADSAPDEYVPSGFAISGTQAWAFIGRDTYSWDWTNKNWDIQTEPVAAARIFRNAVPFDGRLYAPSWADDVGSGGSYVAADEPVNYLHKLISDAGWTLIANSGQTLEGCKYMAVADQKLWGGNWADAADSTLDTGPTVSEANDNTGEGAGTSLTFSHTVPAGNNRLLIVVAQTEDAASGDLSATYNGVAMTALAAVTNGAIKVQVFRLVAPATGANNVVISSTATEDEIIGFAVDFTDVNQTTPLGAQTSATGSSTLPTVNPASEAGDIIFGNIMWQSNPTITPDAGVNAFTDATKSSASNSAQAFYRYVSSGGDIISGTLSGAQDWIAVAVAVKPEIAAATTTFNLSADPTGTLAAGDVIKKGSEYMLVTAIAVSPPTTTVLRGYRGSVAASQTDRNIYEITENVHQVRSSTNGTSYANWSTATSVGDSGSAITGLVGVGNQLVVLKTDGIYTLETDGTVTQRLPGGPAMGHAHFGKGAWSWNDLVFIPLHNGGLWELETITWTIRDISFSHVMPDQTQYHGRIVAGGGEPSHMYVVVLDTTNTMYRVLMTQNPSQLGLSDYNWTQVATISYTTGTDADHAAALLAGVTNGSNTHDRLWVGVESTGSNLLPRYITNSTIDGDDEYSSTNGDAYTVAFDAGFPNIVKRAQSIVLNTANLGAVGGSNHYIDVRYRIDGGSWLYVHTGTGTNTANGSSVTGDNQSISFVAGVTFRKIEFRFTFVRKTSGDQTTPELHDFTFTCQLRTSAIKLLPMACYLANGLRLRNGMTENRALTNRNQLRTWNAQGAEVILTDNEGGTRNCLMLPGRMKETEIANPLRGFPEYIVEFILGEVG